MILQLDVFLDLSVTLRPVAFLPRIAGGVVASYLPATDGITSMEVPIVGAVEVANAITSSAIIMVNYVVGDMSTVIPSIAGSAPNTTLQIVGDV